MDVIVRLLQTMIERLLEEYVDVDSRYKDEYERLLLEAANLAVTGDFVQLEQKLAELATSPLIDRRSDEDD